jgi:hypothetical protein
MPRISVKAVILSNLVHWLVLVVGMIVIIVLGCAGLTIATDGASDFTTALKQLGSSTGLIVAIVALSMLAPLYAGYIAAKIAKEAKLLHGALATSAWMLFMIGLAVWGPPSGADGPHVPAWLDDATTFGAPLPAMLGAYLWQLRARRREASGAAIAAQQREMQELSADINPQREAVASASPSKPKSARRIVGVPGIGIFAWLVLRILVPEPARTWVVLIIVGAVALLIAVALIFAAVKRQHATIDH